jgi:hypothetical protein
MQLCRHTFKVIHAARRFTSFALVMFLPVNLPMLITHAEFASTDMRQFRNALFLARINGIRAGARYFIHTLKRV